MNSKHMAMTLECVHKYTWPALIVCAYDGTCTWQYVCHTCNYSLWRSFYELVIIKMKPKKWPITLYDVFIGGWGITHINEHVKLRRDMWHVLEILIQYHVRDKYSFGPPQRYFYERVVLTLSPNINCIILHNFGHMLRSLSHNLIIALLSFQFYLHLDM